MSAVLTVTKLTQMGKITLQNLIASKKKKKILPLSLKEGKNILV